VLTRGLHDDGTPGVPKYVGMRTVYRIVFTSHRIEIWLESLYAVTYVHFSLSTVHQGESTLVSADFLQAFILDDHL
jgi:hypothetical protein